MDQRHTDKTTTRAGERDTPPTSARPQTWGLAWERRMLATLAGKTAVPRQEDGKPVQ